MPPNRIRANYDVLNQIAKQFGQEADATQRSLRNLQQVVNTLRQGDWIGEGARRFYSEFDSAILPSLKRLLGALENAALTTVKVEEVKGQAEDLTARLFGAGAVGETMIAGIGRAVTAEAENGIPFQQTDPEATEARLNENGITLQSSGNCRDRSNRTCTSLEGIRQETVDGLIAFRNAVGVDLVMTGGTEVGHAAGEHSHGNGYKADISLDPTVNRYIEDNYEHVGRRENDGAELYRDANGNVFAREGNHWDTAFY